MTILFTGASSFTGYWFIKELINSGFHVIATFTKKDIDDYQGIRKERIKEIVKTCDTLFDCKFGSERFIELIQSSQNIDVFCHHAAEVTDYKSENFNIYDAVCNNTFNLKQVTDELLKKECKKIILTGSVFENNEGAEDPDMNAFSPYALSKSITYQIFLYYCHLSKISLGKFVIPNPFGPYEEERFTTYLIKNWINNNTPVISTPDYIRDNIHVGLLAKTYLHFVKLVAQSNSSFIKINPSGYVGTQGAFAERFSVEMKKRLHLKCEYTLNKQIEFNEPVRRVNIDKAETIVTDWSEEQAWNELADYYTKQFITNK